VEGSSSLILDLSDDNVLSNIALCDCEKDALDSGSHWSVIGRPGASFILLVF